MYRHVAAPRQTSASGASAPCAPALLHLARREKTGVCIPRPNQRDHPVTQVEGSAAVPQPAGILNTHIIGHLQATKPEPTLEPFTIRKLSMRSPARTAPSTGRTTSRARVRVQCPLYWLNIGTGRHHAGAGGQLRDRRKRHGAILEIGMPPEQRGPLGAEPLKNQHPHMGKRHLEITYAERPEGQWSGNALYLQFGDRELSAVDGLEGTAAKPDAPGSAWQRAGQKWGAVPPAAVRGMTSRPG